MLPFPWIDLIEIIRKIVEKIRTGRLLAKSSGFNSEGQLVDQESYELEDTKIIRRGVRCFKATVLQIWTIVTVTAQPSGKVIMGPLPRLDKESIVSEQEIECPPDSETGETDINTSRALLSGVSRSV